MSPLRQPHEVDPRRFMANVAEDKRTGCWLWQRGLTAQGYGKVRTGSRRTARLTRHAHLVAYELFVGPIPEGLELDHLCHSGAVIRGECLGGPTCPHRRCVNPAHLEPVTPRTNTLRSRSVSAFNARKTHCKHGHEFTPVNTRVRRGKRECRRCASRSEAAARAVQEDHTARVPQPRLPSCLEAAGALAALHPHMQRPGVSAPHRTPGH
jgi:hypothetical protein